MKLYTVKVKADSNAFFGIKDAIIEFEKYENGNEIWTIETERDIDRLLDVANGVIEYDVEEYDN